MTRIYEQIQVGQHLANTTIEVIKNEMLNISETAKAAFKEELKRQLKKL